MKEPTSKFTDRVNVREARAHLADLLAADLPTVIGDHYHTRALLIPITPEPTFDSRKLAKALVVAQGKANLAFRDLRKGFE